MYAQHDTPDILRGFSFFIGDNKFHAVAVLLEKNFHIWPIEIFEGEATKRLLYIKILSPPKNLAI